MRTIGSPAELERRRRLAVRRLRDGYTVGEVAAFLGVDPSTVRRWRLAARAGPRGLAADKKGARRRGAALAFIDESGLLMGPLVRRSWAPRGDPPTLLQKGRHREKVSVAAALWLPPARDRVGLFTRTLVDGYFDNER